MSSVLSTVANRARSAGRLPAYTAFLALAVASVGSLQLAPANAQAQFTCTQIIGYSTTSTWFPAAEAQLDNSSWQLLWENGGSAWIWADPGWAAWGNAPVSPCSQNSRSPDRVVMDVATNVYTTDVSHLETDIRNVIETIRRKYSSVRQIVLQPEHGGPDHSTCPWSGAPFGVVRATYNHQTIEDAIGRVVGGDVVPGVDPLVRTCDDFADSIGHLTSEGASALGTSNGAFYAAPKGATPLATSTPPPLPLATSTPTPLPPLATSTPTPLPLPLPAAAGACAGSLALNGEDAYAEAPHAAEIDSTSDWTVEAWFKDENPQGFNHARARIITKGDTGGAEVPFFLDIDADYLWAGRRVDGSSQVIGFDLGANGVSADVWHHAAATFDSSIFQLTLYLDGAMLAQEKLSKPSRGNALPISIGRNGGPTANFWQGKLDDVRLWNVVRSASEIQGSYLVELDTPPVGLVANWRFNDGTGSTAADGAVTRHDATLIGGASWSTEYAPGSLTSACEPMGHLSSRVRPQLNP